MAGINAFTRIAFPCQPLNTSVSHWHLMNINIAIDISNLISKICKQDENVEWWKMLRTDRKLEWAIFPEMNEMPSLNTVRVKLKSAIPLCSKKILLNVCLSILKGKRAIGSPYGVYLKQWALKMDKIHDGSSLCLSKCSRCTRQQQLPTDVL